jgi:Family of unknown function (DUF6300)
MSADGSPRPSIDLTCGAAISDCPRCGDPGLMAARLPHGWDRPDGRRTSGTTTVVLCLACDADDPHAGPLITFFHVHGEVTMETVDDAADLILLWAESLRTPDLNIAALEAEAEAWGNGDL